MTTKRTFTKNVVRSAAALAAGLVVLTGCSSTGTVSNLDREAADRAALLVSLGDANGDGDLTQEERYGDSPFVFPIPGSLDLSPEELALGEAAVAAYAGSLGVPGSIFTRGEDDREPTELYNCSNSPSDGYTEDDRCARFEHTYTSTDPAVAKFVSTAFDPNEVFFNLCSDTSCDVNDPANDGYIRWSATTNPFAPTVYTLRVGVYLTTN